MPEEYEPQASASPPLDFGDFSKWRLDSQDILNELEHDLKGEYWSDKDHDWVKHGLQLLNDDGVKTVISLVRTSINKVSFLSNLTEDEILDICRDLNQALVLCLFLSWERFDVKKEHLSLIVRKVMNFIFIALKRAEEGGERESLSRTEQVSRVYSQEKKRGGFFPAIFGRGKSED